MNQPSKTHSSRSTQRVPFNDAFRGLEALKASMTQAAKAQKHAAPEQTAKPPAKDDKPAKDDTVSKPGAKVVVAMERKGHGGKTVTRVEGLDPARVEDIGSEMKRSLGCGATVSDGIVFLQGDQRTRAAEWLKEQGAKRVVVSN